MNILMVSHYTLPHRGGIEMIIEKLSVGFAQKGHKIKVVASKVPGSSKEEIPNRKIIGIKSFDPLRKFGVHYPIFSISLIPALYQAVQWADVVHVQGMLYHNSIIALSLAKAMKRPSVLTEHAGFVQYTQNLFNFTQKIAIETMGRYSMALSDAIIVPDKIVKEILVNSIHITSEKIIRIPLGVDTDSFRPVTQAEKQRLRRELDWDERPKVLFVGNFVPRKRINLLIDSISEKYDIVLCGEGTPPANLTENIFVYPATGHEKLVKMYQASDLFVVPSSVETFSIVAYEAMACGIPVIMTQDLNHLTIKESGTITFVQPNSSDLRKAIHTLLESPEERQRIGLNSAEWTKKFFSWEQSITKHLELYSELRKK